MAAESHVTREQGVPLQLEIAQQTIHYRGCNECHVAVGYPHRQECSMRMPVVNRCPICNRKYDFFTDGSGREIKMHPTAPCVPRVERWKRPRCVMCGGEIDDSRPGPYQKTCKKECAELLFEREKLTSQKVRLTREERLRTYWRAKAAQLELQGFEKESA